MFADRRRPAVFLIGAAAFLQLWAIQALLPMLADYFDASVARIGLTVSAATLAVTLMAPFIGVVADVLGRRRIILVAIYLLTVPSALIAMAATLEQFVALRFLQGLFLPAVFAVAVAYIGDEWPRDQIAGVTAIYTSGSVLGGFLGRFLAGWIGEYGGWRVAFAALAAINLASAIVIGLMLPKERNFVRAGGLLHSVRLMARHFRDARLLATFAVGAGVLFCFVTLFTYISFYLAAPPFDFSAAGLGSIFIVYLFGFVITPLVGRLVARYGRRWLVIGALGCWGAGAALTLFPSLWAILPGLVIGSAAGFICQATSTGYVAYAATRARSSAVGLYVTSYYLGGSAGGVLAGLAWHVGGWPGCVILAWLVLGLSILLVLRFWHEPKAALAIARPGND